MKLKIQAKTWKRDSYGLFDYETTSYNNQDIMSSRAGQITRHNNHISYINTQTVPDKVAKANRTDSGSDETLFKVADRPGKLYLKLS
jgi:hypothetical protein